MFAKFARLRGAAVTIKNIRRFSKTGYADLLSHQQDESNLPDHLRDPFKMQAADE